MTGPHASTTVWLLLAATTVMVVGCTGPSEQEQAGPPPQAVSCGGMLDGIDPPAVLGRPAEDLSERNSFRRDDPVGRGLVVDEREEPLVLTIMSDRLPARIPRIRDIDADGEARVDFDDLDGDRGVVADVERILDAAIHHATTADDRRGTQSA